MSNFTILTDLALCQASPELIVSSMLSTKTFLSEPSSQAVGARHIGEGQCGTVYALEGTDLVIKIPKAHKLEQLYEDCRIHARVHDCFSQLPLKLRPAISIPRFGDLNWIRPTSNAFWYDHIDRFPAGFRPQYGLVTGRIPSLPEPVREAIFKLYAPSQLNASPTEREDQLAQQKNKDCLLRVYLGRRLKRSTTPGSFKLRNLELHVNDFEDLDVDTLLFANTIARTLAFLHWKAGIDANDVEFVLGCATTIQRRAWYTGYEEMDMDDAPPVGESVSGKEVHSQVRRLGLWLLDFNQCKTFESTAAGLKQLVDAFFWNDPYYPRPATGNRSDDQLWDFFKQMYILASQEFLGSKIRSPGPADFVKAVEERAQRQAKGNSLFR